MKTPFIPIIYASLINLYMVLNRHCKFGFLCWVAPCFGCDFRCPRRMYIYLFLINVVFTCISTSIWMTLSSLAPHLQLLITSSNNFKLSCREGSSWLSYFLGINVHHTSADWSSHNANTLRISYCAPTWRILKVSLPWCCLLISSFYAMVHLSPKVSPHYRSEVGALQQLSFTCPNISFLVNRVYLYICWHQL